jgi:hypothetical protein
MKRKNMLAGWIIIGFGGLLVVGLILLFISLMGEREEDFVRHLRNQGRNLFEQVQAFDPDEYPESPREVMQLFMAIRHLLYGDMILNEDIQTYAILTMRELFSQELLEAQTEIEHRAQILSGLEELKEHRIRLHTFQIGTVSFNQFDPAFSLVQVTEHYVGPAEPMQWDYHLIFENGQWRIAGWNKGN